MAALSGHTNNGHQWPLKGSSKKYLCPQKKKKKNRIFQL